MEDMKYFFIRDKHNLSMIDMEKMECTWILKDWVNDTTLYQFYHEYDELTKTFDFWLVRWIDSNSKIVRMQFAL